MRTSPSRCRKGRAYRAYFTADMIWRMAVVAEVSKGDVPPRNPFLRGEPLHYYWLPHLLPAAEYRQVHRQISMEQVLLVNSVALGLAFVLFLFGFVRHWVDRARSRRPLGSLGALVFTSFEGFERLVVFWRTGVLARRGDRSEHRRGHALVLPEPARSTACSDCCGISRTTRPDTRSACRRCWCCSSAAAALTPRLLAFCGCLLGVTLLFSTFAAIMLTMMVARDGGDAARPPSGAWVTLGDSVP